MADLKTAITIEVSKLLRFKHYYYITAFRPTVYSETKERVVHGNVNKALTGS